MKILKSYLVIIVVIFISSCASSKKEYSEYKLAGLWELNIMEIRDTNTGIWSEWRNGMNGYLLYDEIENMTIHLYEKGYEKTDLRFPNFTDTIPLEALKYLTKSYYYIGKYKLIKNEKIVEHTRISHSNPGEWGIIVRRNYNFIGDTLIITPEEEKNANLRLKWIKASQDKIK